MPRSRGTAIAYALRDRLRALPLEAVGRRLEVEVPKRTPDPHAEEAASRLYVYSYGAERTRNQGQVTRRTDVALLFAGRYEDGFTREDWEACAEAYTDALEGFNPAEGVQWDALSTETLWDAEADLKGRFAALYVARYYEVVYV